MKIPIVILAVLGLACGKSLPTLTIKDDLKEFVTLLPTEKLFEITLDYLHYDREVKEFVEYIQSEEFPKIHTFIEYLKEHLELNVPCFHFINEHGFDVYEIIYHIQHVLPLPPYEPTKRTYVGVGLHGLVEDVISVLPLKELKVLFGKKVETREYLKTLVTSVKSPVFKSVLEYVRNWPEYYKLLEVLREKFVDLDHVHELLKELYWRGINLLENELKELLPLDPTNNVLHILLDYLTYDPELKEFVVTVQSEEFPKIHKIVEYLKKYKELYLPCLKYINECGVDVYEIVHELYPLISEIRVLLELPPLELIDVTRTGVGLPGLIEDVIRVLPLKELKVLIEKKVETKEYYNLLYTLIHSTEFLDVVHTVRDLPEYRELVEFLLKIGVHEERFIELIRTLFSLPPL